MTNLSDRRTDAAKVTPTASCGVCRRPFADGEHRVSVRVGDSEPFYFHGEGPCYPIGLQHGTRPIKDDER